jgi:hypothetical protein
MASRRVPLPFAIQYAKGRSARSTAESLINMYAEKAPESAKAPIRLMCSPGSKEVVTFTELAAAIGVVGFHVMNEILYAFTRAGIYKVLANNTAALISPISLQGRVSSADNGTHLVFCDGSRGYYIQDDVVQQILDVDFKQSISVCFLNGYFVFCEKGTGRFFISGLYNITFDPLEFATAEAAPDDAVAVISDHRELWVMGKETAEVFYDSADTDFPFTRVQGAVIEHGIAGAFAFARGDSSIFWLSNDGIIYRAMGYSPSRISTHEVETDIKGRDWERCEAFTFVDEGHTFIQFNFPDRTWVYDAATQLWHVRKHIDYKRHHARCYAYAYRRHYIGHFAKPQVLEMSTDFQDDDGRPLLTDGTTAPQSAAGAMVTYDSVEIFVEVGEGTATGEGATPKAVLSFSDDGGKTWSNEREASIGKAGEHKLRVIWRRLGAARDRTFRIRMSSPVKRILQNVAYAEVS